MESAPREDEVRVLKQTAHEKRDMLQDIPPQTARSEAVLAIQGGFIVIETEGEGDAETRPGMQYLNPDQAREYIEFEIQQQEEERAATDSVKTLKLLEIALTGRCSLLAMLDDVEVGKPLDYEEALSEIIEPLLNDAGYGLAPEVIAQAPAEDRLPNGTPIHPLVRGSRGIPGD